MRYENDDATTEVFGDVWALAMRSVIRCADVLKPLYSMSQVTIGRFGKELLVLGGAFVSDSVVAV